MLGTGISTKKEESRLGFVGSPTGNLLNLLARNPAVGASPLPVLALVGLTAVILEDVFSDEKAPKLPDHTPNPNMGIIRFGRPVDATLHPLPDHQTFTQGVVPKPTQQEYTPAPQPTPSPAASAQPTATPILPVDKPVNVPSEMEFTPVATTHPLEQMSEPNKAPEAAPAAPAPEPQQVPPAAPVDDLEDDFDDRYSCNELPWVPLTPEEAAVQQAEAEQAERTYQAEGRRDTIAINSTATEQRKLQSQNTEFTALEAKITKKAEETNPIKWDETARELEETIQKALEKEKITPEHGQQLKFLIQLLTVTLKMEDLFAKPSVTLQDMHAMAKLAKLEPIEEQNFSIETGVQWKALDAYRRTIAKLYVQCIFICYSSKQDTPEELKFLKNTLLILYPQQTQNIKALDVEIKNMVDQPMQAYKSLLKRTCLAILMGDHQTLITCLEDLHRLHQSVQAEANNYRNGTLPKMVLDFIKEQMDMLLLTAILVRDNALLYPLGILYTVEPDSSTVAREYISTQLNQITRRMQQNPGITEKEKELLQQARDCLLEHIGRFDN